MELFKITDEEKQLILKRRELAAKRAESRNTPSAPVQPKKKPKDVILGANRPPGWDEHCDLDKPHKGRLTDDHPLYWFEENIFKKISNLQHKEQHKKISTLLGVPVQNVYRDRVYHLIQHMEALWQQEMLPLKYKKKIEEVKAECGIGYDGVHPAHKKELPDYEHPVANVKRPWHPDKYDCEDEEAEEFIVGKKYRYEYDDEIGYDYKKAYQVA